jgi:hypothetical protein
MFSSKRIGTLAKRKQGVQIRKECNRLSTEQDQEKHIWSFDAINPQTQRLGHRSHSKSPLHKNAMWNQSKDINNPVQPRCLTNLWPKDVFN